MEFREITDKTKSFFQKLGRRNIIIICSVLLICGAVWLNWRFFSDSGTPDDDPGTQQSGGDQLRRDEESNPTDGYFAASQISRQRARDEAMEVLQSVVDNTGANEAVKNQALEDITRIALDIERESNIETLIKAKGFEQCVAIVNGSSANIIVKSDSLLPSQSAQIYEIVYEQAGIKPADVKIIPRAPA